MSDPKISGMPMYAVSKMIEPYLSD